MGRRWRRLRKGRRLYEPGVGDLWWRQSIDGTRGMIYGVKVGVTGIMGMESEAHLWYLKCTKFSWAMLCY